MSDQLLRLPFYNALSPLEQEYVIQLLAKFFGLKKEKVVLIPALAA